MANGVKITIIDNSPEVKTAFQQAVAEGLETIGLQAERNAKREITKSVYNTPPSPNYIRTGNLRNSITHATDADSAYVGTNVEYAAYVEYGTSKMPSRPYIRPAVENYMDEYQQIMKDALKNG